MPSSTWVHSSTVQDILWKNKPNSILDIGIGFGRWGFLARELLDVFRGRFNKEDWKTRIEGVEIWPKYLKDYHHYIYNKIFVGSIQDFLKANKKMFDVIIAGDVIEHLEKEKAIYVLKHLRLIVNKVLIVCIPLGSDYPQGTVKGNSAEAHLSTWEESDFENLGLIAKLIVKERIKQRPYGVFQLSPIKEVEF